MYDYFIYQKISAPAAIGVVAGARGVVPWEGYWTHASPV